MSSFLSEGWKSMENNGIRDMLQSPNISSKSLTVIQSSVLVSEDQAFGTHFLAVVCLHQYLSSKPP